MKEIVDFINQQIDPLNVESMAADLSVATSYYYTTSTYYAQCEMIYNQELGKASDSLTDTDYTAKEKEFKVKQLVAEFKYKLLRAEGMMKALETKIEALRTLISKAKTEMSLTK